MKPYPRSLRWRIFLSYSLLGALLGVLLAVFLLLALEYLERQFMDAYIMDELTHFIRLTETEPGRTVQESHHWTAYKLKPAQTSLTARFGGLSTGIHEWEQDGKHYDIGVLERAGSRYVLVYDDTRFETLESRVLALLVAIVLLAVAAAACYGFWLSRRVIEPITLLARRVTALPTEQNPQKLSQQYMDDEVGLLARALDERMERLSAFMKRERDFTADASHELRTPLAVIQAASETLLTRTDLPGAARGRVERIERAAREMAQRVSVLLTLARESGPDPGPGGITDLQGIVDQVIEDHLPLVTDSVQVCKKYRAAPKVAAPAVILSMLAGNLVRNAFAHTVSGRVEIRLEPDSLTIADTGPGIQPEEMPHLFERGYQGRAAGTGSGLGLAIVQRLCDHYGWQLSVQSKPGAGTRVTWSCSGRRR